MNWTVTYLDEIARQEVWKLPPDLRAGIVRIIELIEEYGLENIGMPYVRHVRGKLWEIRGKGKSGIARSIYVTAVGRRVVIVRSFVKKSQQTPDAEIEIALKRAKEVK